jgi:hypothetical protein
MGLAPPDAYGYALIACAVRWLVAGRDGLYADQNPTLGGLF